MSGVIAFILTSCALFIGIFLACRYSYRLYSDFKGLKDLALIEARGTQVAFIIATTLSVSLSYQIFIS